MIVMKKGMQILMQVMAHLKDFKDLKVFKVFADDGLPQSTMVTACAAIFQFSILKFQLILLLFFSTTLYAQKTVKICGEYTYPVPENVTQEQAKQTALERAKVQALADWFGTTVAQNNTTVVKNENGKSDISFLSLGGSEIRGEWLEDDKAPEYSVIVSGSGDLFIKVSVCGKAREITGAGVDFSAKVLRNGTDERFENDSFRHGDEIYLLFRSPADGCLAAYLIDDSQTAFCLLPYPNDPEGKVKIRAGKEYVFFSRKHADRSEKTVVSEYTLTCNNKSAENNFLYIVFSPNEFTKANDSDIHGNSKYFLPRELPFDDFLKWLAKNRLRDKDMKVEIKSLIIKK